MQANAKIKPRNFQLILAENRRLQSVDHYLRVINDFSITIASLKDVDGIVWAIVNHAIAHLDFEDCVVYLLNKEREILVQKAAFGPKNPAGTEIVNQIEIPVGEGIVGSVAKLKQPLCVIDTRKDSRYIVDDQVRLSELAVPIMFEDEVLGIIDSEHSEVGFFTPRHQKFLLTLASLAAPRLAFYQTAETILQDTAETGAQKIMALTDALSKLKETNQELAEAMALAQEVGREKTDLLRDVGFQLRTPLTTILGFSEMIIEQLSQQDGAEVTLDDIGQIETAGRELKSLLENFSTTIDSIQKIQKPNPSE